MEENIINYPKRNCHEHMKCHPVKSTQLSIWNLPYNLPPFHHCICTILHLWMASCPTHPQPAAPPPCAAQLASDRLGFRPRRQQPATRLDVALLRWEVQGRAALVAGGGVQQGRGSAAGNAAVAGGQSHLENRAGNTKIHQDSPGWKPGFTIGTNEETQAINICYQSELGWFFHIFSNIRRF